MWFFNSKIEFYSSRRVEWWYRHVQKMLFRSFFDKTSFSISWFFKQKWHFHEKLFFHGIRNKWISDSNPSHRKDSDGQIISPYACYIAICHPKMCFHKAGQASLNQQSGVFKLFICNENRTFFGGSSIDRSINFLINPNIDENCLF